MPETRARSFRMSIKIERRAMPSLWNRSAASARIVQADVATLYFIQPAAVGADVFAILLSQFSKWPSRWHFWCTLELFPIRIIWTAFDSSNFLNEVFIRVESWESQSELNLNNKTIDTKILHWKLFREILI